MFFVDEELVEHVGLVIGVKRSFRDSQRRPHQIPQGGLAVGLNDLATLAGAHSVDHHRGVERLVVEVTHHQRRRVQAVDLQRPMVEVEQRLGGNVAVAGGLGLAATSRRPVVAEY
jgi:hypothetical protein